MILTGNSQPHNEILAFSKLKTSADEKLQVGQMMKFALERVENIVGKRRKCW